MAIDTGSKCASSNVLTRKTPNRLSGALAKIRMPIAGVAQGLASLGNLLASYIAQTGTASTFSASRYGSLVWQTTWPKPTS